MNEQLLNIIVGIGDSGHNMIKYMLEKDVKNVEFISINKESDIKKLKKNDLEYADLVFIVGEIQNENDEKLACNVAKILKKNGNFVIGFVKNISNKTKIKTLTKNFDSIIKIDNTKKIYQIINKILNSLYEDIIPMGFNDFRYVMSDSRITFIKTAHKSGKNSAYKALKEVINLFYLDGIDIMNARGLIIYITTSINYSFDEFDENLEVLFKEFFEQEQEEIRFVEYEFYNDSFKDDEIEVTIFANGF